MEEAIKKEIFPSVVSLQVASKGETKTRVGVFQGAQNILLSNGDILPSKEDLPNVTVKYLRYNGKSDLSPVNLNILEHVHYTSDIPKLPNIVAITTAKDSENETYLQENRFTVDKHGYGQGSDKQYGEIVSFYAYFDGEDFKVRYLAPHFSDDLCIKGKGYEDSELPRQEYSGAPVVEARLLLPELQWQFQVVGLIYVSSTDQKTNINSVCAIPMPEVAKKQEQQQDINNEVTDGDTPWWAEPVYPARSKP